MRATAIVVALSCALLRATPPTSELLQPGTLLYDESAHRLLMLNAHRMSEQPGHVQVWEWKDREWRVLETQPGPSARSLEGAVLDSRRQRIVLYGGLGKRGLEDPRADTWEWDGKRWVDVSDPSIGSRDHHSMAFDEGRGRTVMFGGVSSVFTPQGTVREHPAETWEWDGRRWTRASTTGPAARGGAAMVYDRARKVIVMFGGIGLVPGAPTRFNDTWTWDGRTWRQVSNEGPVARNGQAIVFDRRTNSVLMWGGTTGPTHLDDMWRWDGTRWTQVAVEGVSPSKRTGAAMVYDTTRQLVLFFGGRLREGGRVVTSNEMWEWQGGGWIQVRTGG